MAYKVLALKYRPKTFNEVVGQKAAVTTLTNALREARIAHGYVFSGVRGVGKTTLARIFAKALNCVRGPTADPCGECDSCREIAEGHSLDVFEIDGASNSGVDKMRELLETVRYSPARDRYKVFIIDEFHQISRAAFNALLKTLEEPPPHVTFIMATTEIGKVLPTILSRCQQFDLRRITSSEIASQLRRIASAEGITISDRTLDLLARSAGGSMRDAITALDQIIAACGSSVGDEEARTVLGVIPEEEVDAFFTALADRDTPGLLRLIARVSGEGYDLVAFGAELYHAARRLLLARSMPDAAEVLDLSSQEAERARGLARRFGEDELLRVFNVIEEIQNTLRYSSQPRFLLEATAVRLARLGELVPMEEILARLDAIAAAPPSRGVPAKGVPAAATADTVRGPRPAPPPAPSVVKKKLQPAGSGEAETPGEPARGEALAGSEHVATPSGPPHTDAPEGACDPPVADASLPPEAGLFERLLERLESENPALAASLGTAEKPVESAGALVLPYPQRSAAFRRRVEEPANLELIAKLASEVAGRPVSVRTTTAAGGAVASQQARRGEAGGPVSKALADRALSDPVVKTVIDVFRARLLEVQEK